MLELMLQLELIPKVELLKFLVDIFSGNKLWNKGLLEFMGMQFLL